MPVVTVANPSIANDANDSPVTPVTPVTPKRTLLDARLNDLALSLPWLQPKSECDTLVFIDLPNLPGDPKALHNGLARDHFENGFRVSSDLLRNLQSPFFDRKLKEPYQTALRSRRNIEKPPEGIKYILDLTPKSEGDEAVQYMEDLSCPIGLRHWFESCPRWGTPSELVSGYDDFTPPDYARKRLRIEETMSKEAQNTTLESDKGERVSPQQLNGKSKDATPASTQQAKVVRPEPEYSQLRHRLAIERFLLTLHGQDPRFDSAVKLYTTVMATKAFDIRGYHPTTDDTISWLYAECNSRFIEVLPEATLSMAEVLRNEALTRDAFSVLVGEAVLDGAMNHLSSNQTCLGRQRISIDETWQSRIEYARNSLTEIIQAEFNSLAGNDMVWIHELETVQSLKRSSPIIGGQVPFQKLLHILKDFVRGAIYHILVSSYTSMPNRHQPVDQGSEGRCLYPQTTPKDQWDGLSPQARILTRQFWSMLESFHFEGDSTFGDWNFETRGRLATTNYCLSMTRFIRDGPALNSLEYWETSLYKEVKYLDLSEAVKACLVHHRRPTQPVVYQRCEVQGCPYYYLAGKPTCPACDGRFCNAHKDRIPHNCHLHTVNVQAVQKSLSQDQKKASEDFHVQELGQSHLLPNTGLPLRPSNIPIYAKSPEPILPLTTSGVAYSPSYRPLAPPQSRPDSDAGSSDSDAAWEELLEVGGNDLKTAVTMTNKILREVKEHIKDTGRQGQKGPQGGQLGNGIALYNTPVLLCLQESEMRYLPLWAGGLDDGTSGVYTGNVPLTADGFKGPPAATDELSIPGLGGAYDPLDDRRTVATSAVANDGYGDPLNRHKVYAMSEVESEDWDFVRNGAAGQAAPEFPVTFNPTGGPVTFMNDRSGDALGVISESGISTPTGGQTPKEVDIMGDGYMDFPDDDSNDEIASDGSDNEELGAAGTPDDATVSTSTHTTTTNGQESYILDAESVSYGGFSDPEMSSAGIVTPPHGAQSSELGLGTQPGAGAVAGKGARSTADTAASRPKPNNIGADFKYRNPDANVYYVYKDGPEDDLLTRL